MDGRTFALSLTVLVVLGVVSLAVIMVIGPSDIEDDRVLVEDVGDVRSIVYVTDGGSMPDDPRICYIPGTYTSLPVPVKGEMFFEGWYLDAAHTIPIGAITPSMDSDLILYASWTEFDPVGHGTSMDFIIEYGEGDGRVRNTGVMTWTYMVGIDGAYYIQRDITWSDDGDGRTETGGYWTDETEGSEYRYIGNGEVDGRLCEIWSDGNGENQWIYRGFTVMKIEYSHGTNHQLFTFRESVDIVPDLSFTPNLRVGMGITVQCDDVLEIGSEAVFTVSGDGFTGWYMDGVLISEDRSLNVSRVDPNMAIEARSHDVYEVVEGDVDPMALGFHSDVRIIDGSGDEMASGSGPFSLDTGFYTVESVSDGIVVYRDIVVEGHSSFTHTWSYDGREFMVGMDLLYSEVYMDTYTDGYHNIRMGLGQEHDSRFLSADASYVRTLASELERMTEGMDDVSRAGMVLTFVQTIPYITDEGSRGSSEFWKYPSETLWDGGGDCEDSSILYASLMSCMGYRTCVAVFSEHAMAGIVLDGVPEDHDTFIHEGVTFTFAETTGTSLGLWKTADRFKASDIVYIIVPRDVV